MRKYPCGTFFKLNVDGSYRWTRFSLYRWDSIKLRLVPGGGRRLVRRGCLACRALMAWHWLKELKFPDVSTEGYWYG